MIEILLDAAAGGLALEDIAGLARKIDEAWQAQHPARTTATGTLAMRTGPGTGTCGSAPPWTGSGRWTGT
jgi:hypothetical protein